MALFLRRKELRPNGEIREVQEIRPTRQAKGKYDSLFVRPRSWRLPVREKPGQPRITQPVTFFRPEQPWPWKLI